MMFMLCITTYVKHEHMKVVFCNTFWRISHKQQHVTDARKTVEARSGSGEGGDRATGEARSETGGGGDRETGEARSGIGGGGDRETGEARRENVGGGAAASCAPG